MLKSVIDLHLSYIIKEITAEKYNFVVSLFFKQNKPCFVEI